jgi:phage-related tail protein
MTQPDETRRSQPGNIMQSAMEKAGITTSPDPTQKVVTFENVKDIARAVRYADEELRAHLELGTANTDSKLLILKSVAEVIKIIHLARTNREITQCIDQLLKIVDELDQAVADSLSGARAEITELTTEIEGLQSGNAKVSSTIPTSMIDAELRRRSKASEVIGTIQEQLEDDKAQAEARLGTVKQQISAGGGSQAIRTEKRNLEAQLTNLNTTIASIIDAVRVNSEKEGLLIAYKSSLKFIQEGLPKDIFGEKLFDRV